MTAQSYTVTCPLCPFTATLETSHDAQDVAEAHAKAHVHHCLITPNLTE
ncbi:MAG: hypothetical protein M0R06_22365 [Sphaerochaeta sp.]|jgi:hypothetical protein|nr:hypothetical protein [Sphaerochaeta sp.]